MIKLTHCVRGFDGENDVVRFIDVDPSKVAAVLDDEYAKGCHLVSVEGSVFASVDESREEVAWLVEEATTPHRSLLEALRGEIPMEQPTDSGEAWVRKMGGFQ